LEGRERLTVEKFVTRSKAGGAIYLPHRDEKMPPWRLIAELSQFELGASRRHWFDEIRRLDDRSVREVFEAFPPGWISQPAQRFALELLKCTARLMGQESSL
jgi:hypothetical protein